MKRFLAVAAVIVVLTIFVAWGVYFALLKEGFSPFVTGVGSGAAALFVGGCLSWGTLCAFLRQAD